jgi:hypothetical protein
MSFGFASLVFGPPTCSIKKCDITVTDMDIENPKIPKWTHHEHNKKEIHIDENSGLVTTSIIDDPIMIIGVWNNTSQTYDKVTPITKAYAMQLKTMNVNCEIEPLRAAWLTDFTLSCLDRDILVVKECLTRTSNVFKNMLDSYPDNSIDVKFDSTAVFEVMEYIHTNPMARKFNIRFYMSRNTSVMDQGIVMFCFEYQIEPLLAMIKADIGSRISSDIDLDFKSWLKFFHSFKNLDETEPFRDQIDLLLKFIVKNNLTKEYNMWASLDQKTIKMM